MKARDQNPQARVDEELEDERPLRAVRRSSPSRMAWRSIRMPMTHYLSSRALASPAG